MNYTPKTEEFQYTESMCWVQMGEIICGGGEMNIYQASDRVIADTIDMTDCIPYDSMKALEHNIEFSDSFKVYSDMRPSGLLNVAIHLDWSCTDPFIRNSRRLTNHWEKLGYEDVYVRILKITLKGYDCPENPTKILYSNPWLAEMVLYECVENPDDYVVHDLEYEEWIRKNGIVYPGTIIRRK
jgi:hypothetical protein